MASCKTPRLRLAEASLLARLRTNIYLPRSSIVKRPYCIAWLLLICLTPGTCLALGDGIEGAAILVALIKFESCWVLFVLAVFLLLLLRKMTMSRRVDYCLVLWCAQILIPFVVGWAMELYGEPGAKVVEQAKQPVVLAGVTFPVGSRVEYTQLGRGFWRRTLTGVTSAQPVALGSLSITGLTLDDQDANTAIIDLIHPESIEGWSCDGIAHIVVTSGPPQLSGCITATPRVIGDLIWPAKTYVDRKTDGGWSVSWMGLDRPDAADPHKNTFGLPADHVEATYDASYQLQSWQGRARDSDVKVAGYTFGNERDTQMTWVPPGEIIRIEGYGKEDKTNAVVTCVLLRLQDRTARPCEKEPQSPPATSQPDALDE